MYLKLLGRKGVHAGGSFQPQRHLGGRGTACRRARWTNSTPFLERQGASARIRTGYGLTETAGVCVVNTRAKHRDGSVGYPLPGTVIGIYKDGRALPAGEVGEIWLDTEQRMLGYLGEESSPFTEADGRLWLRTGDYGYVDGDGFLYFKQRIKNMIKVSGVPVYPSEVETGGARRGRR